MMSLLRTTGSWSFLVGWSFKWCGGNNLCKTCLPQGWKCVLSVRIYFFIIGLSIKRKALCNRVKEVTSLQLNLRSAHPRFSWLKRLIQLFSLNTTKRYYASTCGWEFRGENWFNELLDHNACGFKLSFAVQLFLKQCFTFSAWIIKKRIDIYQSSLQELVK